MTDEDGNVFLCLKNIKEGFALTHRHACHPVKGGTPYGTRTRVSAVKGRRPRPLDEGRFGSGL